MIKKNYGELAKNKTYLKQSRNIEMEHFEIKLDQKIYDSDDDFGQINKSILESLKKAYHANYLNDIP